MMLLAENARIWLLKLRALINYLPRFQFVRFGLDDFQLALLDDIGRTRHVVLDTINERTLHGRLVRMDRGGIRGVG